MKEVKIGEISYKIKPITSWNYDLLQKAEEQKTEESHKELFKAFVDPQPSDEDSFVIFMEIKKYANEIVRRAPFFREKQGGEDDRSVESNVK